MAQNNPIFLALDLDSADRALELAKSCSPYVGGFKVGPRLGLKYGEDFITRLSELGQVFVDFKFYDIPNTMLSSLRASFAAGASYATIHAQCGLETLKQIRELEQELGSVRPFTVLAVTVLTSYSKSNRPSLWRELSITDQVRLLVEDVKESGLHGVVCSAQEVSKLKEQFPEGFFVTPGIRKPDDAGGDQKRIMGPKEAVDAGSDLLVVGRPIVDAQDPVAAAKAYYETLFGGAE